MWLSYRNQDCLKTIPSPVIGCDDTCSAVANDCMVVASDVYGPNGLMYLGSVVVPITPFASHADNPCTNKYVD